MASINDEGATALTISTDGIIFAVMSAAASGFQDGVAYSVSMAARYITNLIGLFIFLWILLFIFRVFLRPMRWHRQWDFWSHDGAEEILRERYARGDITKEQFDRMMEDIHRNKETNL